MKLNAKQRTGITILSMQNNIKGLLDYVDAILVEREHDPSGTESLNLHEYIEDFMLMWVHDEVDSGDCSAYDFELDALKNALSTLMFMEYGEKYNMYTPNVYEQKYRREGAECMLNIIVNTDKPHMTRLQVLGNVT